MTAFLIKAPDVSSVQAQEKRYLYLNLLNTKTYVFG
jgi:hypothetical protein